MKIKSIEIENFRGIPFYKLKPNDKSLLIYGENGTGKSSIIEAIEYFFTNKISSLQGYKGVSIRKHACHASSSIENLKIKMTLNPGTKIFQKCYNTDVKPSPEFKEIFEIAKSGTFILRRNQLLYFIACTPKEKFKALASIIKLNHLDNIEREFENAVDLFQYEYTSKNEEKNRFFRKISNLLGRRITTINNAFTILNRDLNLLDSSFGSIITLSEIEKTISDLSLGTDESFKLDIQKNNLLGIVNKLEIARSLEQEISEAKYLIEEVQRDENYSHLNLQKMLKVSYSILQQLDEDICPLCEQYITRSVLIEKTRNRLTELQSLYNKVNEIKRKIKRVTLLANDLKTNIEEILESSQYSEVLSKEKGIFEIILTGLNSILEKDLMDDLDDTQDILSNYNSTSNDIYYLHSTINEKIQSTKIVYPDASEKDRRLLFARKLIDFKNGITDILDIQKFQEKKKKQLDIAKSIWNTFKESKIRVLQDTFDKIQNDIERYYKILHEKDPHENIQLEILSRQKASAQIKIDSFGRKDEDPRGFLSDGHIDSLGICIFLAFIKNFNKSLKLLILDDIVTTIDSNHRENICKLLFEEFSDYQMIITTHDRIWYEQIRSFQRSHKLEGDFKNLTIRNWDFKSGPFILPYQPVWERIKNFLKNDLTSPAANEGRRYLEWLLMEICVATEAKVCIRKDYQYTVSDLFEPAKSRLQKLVSNDKLNIEFEQKFNNLSNTLIYANFLSHNNPFAENLSKKEVQSFCKSVKELHASMQCESCSSLLIYIRKIKRLRCSNSKCESPTEMTTK